MQIQSVDHTVQKLSGEINIVSVLVQLHARN
jgi:hypothetical protein